MHVDEAGSFDHVVPDASVGDSPVQEVVDADEYRLSGCSDRTITKLGLASNSSPVVFDDTYVYWANEMVDGTVIRSPKVTGGNGTVLAHDVSPFAVAVDAHAIYWSDAGGNIKRLAK